MSGNPTTPSNVVPMPTNWPGPMFTPKTFPPGGPSCFSELAALNACYDSIQMMNQILAKVITDLVTNDAAVQTAIVNAIAAAGSNVPLIGVTNGSNPQPGQVGEFLRFPMLAINIPATANYQQTVSFGVIPPGDWDVYGYINTHGSFAGVGLFGFEQAGQAGYSDPLYIYWSDITADINSVVPSNIPRLSSAVPTLLAGILQANQGGGTPGAGTLDVVLMARRRR